MVVDTMIVVFAAFNVQLFRPVIATTRPVGVQGFTRG